MRRPPYLLALTASLSTSTALTHPSNLFARQSASACPSSFSFCANSGFPSSFCCPASSSCITLASNTTLLCCPPDTDCTRINPVVCDVAQQNATTFPTTTIKTTNLDGAMVKCGPMCCPFGFSCNNGVCIMDADQKLLAPPVVSSSTARPGTSSSSLPKTASANPSSTSAPSASPASSTTSTTSPSSSSPAPPALPNITTSPPNTCASFPAPAILAGFFPGLLAGILLSLLTLCLLGARRRKTPKISSPTFQGTGTDFRTDFVRRYQPSLRASQATQNETAQMVAPGTPMQRMRSLFRKSEASSGRGTASAPRGLGMGLGLPASPAPRRLVPGAAGVPVTPRLQREPSSESINIFADPSTAGSGSVKMQMRERATNGDRDRESKYTTFTDMMERAELGGVGRGEPYVPVMEAVPRLSPSTYTPRPGDGSPRGRGGRG